MGLILGARGFFVVNSVGCGLFSLTVNVVCLCQIVRTDVVSRLIHLLFQTLGFVGNLFSSRPLIGPVMSHDDATTATTTNDDDGLRGVYHVGSWGLSRVGSGGYQKSCDVQVMISKY